MANKEGIVRYHSRDCVGLDSNDIILLTSSFLFENLFSFLEYDGDNKHQCSRPFTKRELFRSRYVSLISDDE